MKRRGFLGFMGGAAVAGPAVAKNVVAELPNGLLDGKIGFASGLAQGYPVATKCEDQGEWRIKEIANLKRLMTGELTDDEKEERRRTRLYNRQTIISHGVACLVSVSGVHKLRMNEERMERHGDEMRKLEARSRLSWLLRQED